MFWRSVLMELSNKICVVTGGSRGIGRSICLEFAKAGATVLVNYNFNENAANEVVEQIKSFGGKAESICADVSDSSKVDTMIKYIVKKYKTIDILVNNAGITKDSLLVRLKEEDWDKVIDTNLKGVFNTSKAVAKIMFKKRQGRMINIASIVGIYGNAGQTNYAAAKSGVIGFTKSLAKELGPRGITVNAVAPGFIKTDMTASLLEKDFSLGDKIPLKRIGKPEDVANIVVFLASEKADYITGQVIAIDGGLTL